MAARGLRADAFALAERLMHAFETHGAGPFSLRTQVQPVGGSFRFLGYEVALSPDGRTLVANAPAGVVDAKAIELANDLCEASTADDLILTCSRLQGFLSAYPLAEDARVMGVEVLDLIRVVLDARSAVVKRNHPRPWMDRNVSRT